MISGTNPYGIDWEEQFELIDGMARRSTPTDHDFTLINGKKYYVSLEYKTTFELPLLVNVLLSRPDYRLPLLPDGEAMMEELGPHTINLNERTQTLIHYAVHGLDLAPEYIWLDENGRFFADEVSILKGWENLYPELIRISQDALINYGYRIFNKLIPAERKRLLVIQNAKLFDSGGQSLKEGTTIVIQGDRIEAVGPDGSIELPNGSEMIDAGVAKLYYLAFGIRTSTYVQAGLNNSTCRSL